MKRTGGQIVVQALEDAGVPFAFGIPGTHNLELYDALARSRSIRSVLVTHEQSAAFMADAVWRASGRLACLNLVPGAGLTHAMSGIAEAFLDQVPMLVMSSGIRSDLPFGYQLHDVDQKAIAAPVMKGVLCSPSIEELAATVRHGCELAVSGIPGPVMVEVPTDQFLFRTGAPHRDAPESAVPSPVCADDLDRAAALLNRARRPLIYVGQGARGARSELLALAEMLGAPVATTFQGKGVFPETHPLFLWPGFGPAAPAFVRKIARGCDTTLAVGCRFAEVATASYGAAPPQPLVHIDLDRAALGRNYEAAVAIEADAAAALRGLCERVQRREALDALHEPIRRGHEKVNRKRERAARSGRVCPAVLLKGLQEHFGPGAIFTTDSGNGLFLAMECLRLSEPGRFLAPVDFSCMGYAVPAAVGAKLACATSPVIALVGDGAFLMTGLELITAIRERLPLAIFVLRDGELAQIAHFQKIALGTTICSDVGKYDLEAFSRCVGADFLRLNEDIEIRDCLQQLDSKLHDRRVVVVDVRIDYSRKSYFTRGVMRTNLERLPLPDRLRFIGRAVRRRLFS